MRHEILKGIRHLFKLDPAKELNDEWLKRLLHSGTDGIIIGGTDGITRGNTNRLMEHIRTVSTAKLPIYQEVTSADAILPGVDAYLIPFVLNATDPHWLIGAHVEAIKRFGGYIPWGKLVVEGYLILNPEAKAFQFTRAVLPIDLNEAIAYAEAGGRLLNLPLIYLEYSGRYGDPVWVEAIRKRLPDAHLIYGGGITSREEAVEMAQWADTIVVGNILYRDMDRALATVFKK